MKFKGDKFPKSADDLLGKKKSEAPASKDQWLALISAVRMMSGPDEKKPKKKAR